MLAPPPVLMQMITYNPRAVAFGLLYAHLDWQDSGQIVMTFQVQVGGKGGLDLFREAAGRHISI